MESSKQRKYTAWNRTIEWVVETTTKRKIVLRRKSSGHLSQKVSIELQSWWHDLKFNSWDQRGSYFFILETNMVAVPSLEKALSKITLQ